MNEIKEVHWSGLHGNPLLRSLHTQMIDGVYLELKFAILKGAATKHGTAVKEKVKVVYDRQFAIAKLSMVLMPLKKLPREVVEQLVSEAVNYIYSDKEIESDGD